MSRVSVIHQLENLPPGTLRYRLRQIIGNSTILHFAKRIGVPDSTMRKYLNGHQPTADRLVTIAEATGISLQWLLTGEGPQYLDSEEEEEKDPEMVSIPLHDVEASAGGGALLDQPVEEVERIEFQRSWLHRQFHTGPAGLVLLYVRGESMEPTLKSGDVILVDRKATEPRDGIFVVRFDGTLLVKRLQVYPGKIIEVCSDNQAYKSFELDVRKPPEDFAVIGRVLCSIHNHV
ncbi:MAG: helix-turn-helix transcriptional regulator [Synechococcaceae cyanobacterium SM2_3_1]|nr:helix-turn-helix transcriptional regulator [Synechococcaceae cyanobacterium SM2_3_1]